MADQVLAKSGLFLDDLNKIRVVNPGAAQDCGELKEDCGDFVAKTVQFESVVDQYIGLVGELARRVDKEKIKAIGLRNLRQSTDARNQVQVHQIKALIRDKQIQLERLRVQYESLVKEEAEQREVIQHLLAPK